MKYRADIDGLRGIAVIVVILFHAGFETFSGGFVGVDIFFVISGYLITTIILTELDKGHFSLVNFYERRVRRILPALVLVLTVSLIYAWFRLLPVDMEDFARSLVAVSTFSSNILFWQTSGYWETSSDIKPLLHTWSLAVEEQYYLIFPLFLMFMWRFRKRWIFASFMLVAILSLAVAQWGAYNKPSASFYLLPTRAWEIAIGAVLAFIFLYKLKIVNNIISNTFLSNIMAILGLTMIGYSVFFFDANTPFPSFYALIPTLGTGLIVFFSTSETITGRLLSTKPLVTIGLISYSAYLWHQPLFAFTRLQSLIDPVGFDLTLQIILSFLLAYLSWRFVEGYFRDKTKISRTPVFLFGLLSSFAFISIGLLGVRTEGFESRITSEQKQIMAYDDYDFNEIYRKGTCQLTPEQTSADFSESCYPSVVDNDTIFFWGDSHAAALSYGFRELHPNMIQLTSAGCRPLIDVNGEGRRCQEVNNFILNKINELKPGYVLLHADWIGELDDTDGLSRELSTTVTQIRNISPNTQVLLIGGVPQWKPSLPKIMLSLHVKLSDGAYVYSNKYDDIQSADTIVSQVANDNQSYFISILDMFCENKECLSSVKVKDEFEPFAWDYGHLTRSSSILIADNILKMIATK